MLEAQVGLLESMVDSLRSTKMDVRSEAEFDPADPKFQIINSNTVPLAVSISDVRPFADGISITMDIGNLSSAIVPGAMLAVTYGPRFPSNPGGVFTAEWGTAFGNWQKSLLKHSASVASRLLPGKWNQVRVTLPNIKAESLGYLAIQIDTDSIILDGSPQ